MQELPRNITSIIKEMIDKPEQRKAALEKVGLYKKLGYDVRMLTEYYNFKNYEEGMKP